MRPHRSGVLGWTVCLIVSVSLLACRGADRSVPAVTSAPSGGASAPEPAAQSEQDLYEAAKREGKVVYSTTSQDLYEIMRDAFGRKYPGIQVEGDIGRGSDRLEKTLAQIRAGRVLVDVFHEGAANAYQDALQDLFEPYRPPNVDQSTLKDRSAEQGYAYIHYYHQARFPVFNTDLVPPDREPRAWADLADPWFKGKLLQDDPRSVGGGLTWLYLMANTPGLGRPYLEKMAQQGMVFTRQVDEAVKQIARGEYAALVSSNFGPVVAVMGAGVPIKVVQPREGTILTPFALGLVKGAPHPNAARLFINFALSEEGQAALATRGLVPVRRGTQALYPELNLEGRPVLIYPDKIDADEQRRYLELATQLFGKN